MFMIFRYTFILNLCEKYVPNANTSHRVGLVTINQAPNINHLNFVHVN